MRVPRMGSALPLAFCFLMLICNAVVLLSQSTTTTVTIPNTVKTSGIDRPGINLGGVAYYGSQQLLKSLNYASGGYMPGQYFATTFSCSSGGAQSTTNWYNSITSASGFPANFWAGATFVAINASNGTSYGSGTITASTSNVSSGANFTLSPAISSACSSSNNDVLIVRLNAQNTLEPPNSILRVCSGATWDTSDTSPASTNTIQSLEMPAGCTLTYYFDATMADRTNSNGYGSSQVNFINLNGSYNATFKAKCAVSGCSLNFALNRIGGTTFVASTTVNPSYSTTPGAGWRTYNYPFTGSETGSQSSIINYAFTCTGTCLIQDADVVEDSALAGNTTVFRDAVVYELQKIHPGSIRYMDTGLWCSDVADEIAPTGNRRWCGGNEYTPGLGGTPIGYNDVLALGNVVGSDVLLSVGLLNGASDWTTLINWLSSSGWISTYSASGHKIYLEAGNEAWNWGVMPSLYNGNGTAYGYTLGLNMAAARAASGYNSSVIKLVGNSWVASNQGYGPYGWVHNVLTVAQATPNGLPDIVDDAPYMLNYLGNFDTYGSSVATTGAPFLDEWAEDANVDSVTSAVNTTSMYLNQQYAQTTFGVGTLVYEVNESTTQGIAVSQLQFDQINASVGNALSTAEHVLLMQRDSQVTGPIHVFTLANPYNGYSCTGSGCVNGVVMPLWGTNLFMATGPEQTPGSANTDRPLAIALAVINNAIGSNSNLMSVTQSGTPTFNYPGGQAGSIQPNAAVPYVNCFAYSNGQGSWTTICFNNNLTTAESVNLTGPGAPTGPVSETIFPQQGNVITDHNEDTFLGAASSAPVVGVPTASSASGATYSIPPASFIALTYTAGSGGGTSTLAPPTFSPGSGTYPGPQTVTISFPTGATACVGINTTPSAPTAGTCGAGGTTYTGPITVSNSETLNAIATEAGSSNSAVATATYIINLPVAAAPAFSPAGGTYTGAQTVTISTATPGATIYYTTDGTTPTTSSSVYSGPITVSSSETLEAIAAEIGYTQSAVAAAKYTINSGGGTVAFYPGTLSYLPQSSPYPSLLEPQAVVVTKSGSDLFVADEGGKEVGDTYTFNGAVWDYPQPSGAPTKIGGSFVAPSALALDTSGDLYIADYNLGAVYTAPAANRSSVTQLTISGVTLYHPTALAFDPGGNLYIGDTGPDGSSASATNPGFIVKVPAGGGTATKLSYTISGAPVIFPQALATDTAGNLYIADAGNGQTNFGDLVVVPANTGVPSYIPTGSYTLNGPAGLGFDPALDLYVLDGYNARVLTIPVTLAATTETPSFGTAALLPQTIPIAVGSSMLIWPSGQEITITDIGDASSSPVTQVVTLDTQTANIAFGPISLGSNQNGTVTAINVGNITANFTPQYTETGDTVGFTANLPVCSGGIASQQQCKISFTYQPDQAGSTTAQFSFYVNSAATPSNYVNASGTSTEATGTVTRGDVQTMLTHDQGTKGRPRLRQPRNADRYGANLRRDHASEPDENSGR
jgi:hypothetical protein